MKSEKFIIKEELFDISNKDFLKQLLGEEQFLHVSGFSYHRIVYMDNGLKQIPLLNISGNKKENYRLTSVYDFKGGLSKLNYTDFNNILYYLTAYPIIGTLPKPLSIKQGHTESFIDHWLKPTGGRMVYTYQLEHLFCMLTGESAATAIQFRKDWNLKRPSSRRTAAEICIDDGASLLETIESRTIEENKFVFTPAFEGAYRLWSYIIKERLALLK